MDFSTDSELTVCSCTPVSNRFSPLCFLGDGSHQRTSPCIGIGSLPPGTYTSKERKSPLWRFFSELKQIPSALTFLLRAMYCGDAGLCALSMTWNRTLVLMS